MGASDSWAQVSVIVTQPLPPSCIVLATAFVAIHSISVLDWLGLR